MIKYVDLLKTNKNGDGGQVSILRFKLDTNDEDQKIVVEKLNDFKGDYKDFLTDGEYIVGKNGKVFSIEDHGIMFLKNLEYEFKNTYIRATNVNNLS